MVGRSVVAWMLVACLFAGCVANPAPEGGRSRDLQAGAVAALGGAEADPVSSSAEARPAGADPEPPVAPSTAAFEVLPQLTPQDVAPWYLAAMDVAGEDAALAGFRWTVPPGSVHEDEDYGMEGVSLEVAFLVPEGEEVDSYTVSWFVMDGDVPSLLGIELGMPLDYTVKTSPALSTPDSVAMQRDPAFVYFDSDRVDDGTELGIVVSAAGPAHAFGFAWRVLDHNVVFSDESPSPSSKAFLKDVAALGPGLSLQPRGTGAGFQAALYLDLNIVFAIGVELIAGNVQVTDGLPTEAARPTATVRELSLASKFENPAPDQGGWGLALGIYLTASGVAPWEAKGDVHGQALDESGTAVGSMAIMPAYFTVLGKEGPASDVAMDLTIASADYVEILAFITLDYGTKVSTLLGSQAPANSIYGVAAGGPSETPTAEVRGNDLVLQGAGLPRVTLLGAGALAA